MKAPKKSQNTRKIEQELDDDLLADSDVTEMELAMDEEVQESEDADTYVKPTAEDISSIYELEDEEDVDMTTMVQNAVRSKWKLIVASIAALCVIGATVWFIFFGGSGGDGDVVLGMKVDSKVASGDVVNIEITYSNNKSVPLTSGTLEVFYPDGFALKSTSVEPEKSDGKSFYIENIPAGGSGKIRIVGQLVGTKDDKKEFSTQLTYRPQNFSQDFQVTAKSTATITSSIIELSIEAPEQVKADAEFETVVTFKNTGTTDLEKVQVLATYPDGFEYVQSSKETYARENEWRYDLLKAGEEQELKVKGKIAGKSGDKVDMKFQIGIVELDDSFNIQTEMPATILLIDPSFDISLTIPETVTPGAPMEIKGSIKNTSGAALKKITPKLELSGSLFNETSKNLPVIDDIGIDEQKEFTVSTTLNPIGSNTEVELVVKLVIPNVTVSGTEVKVDISKEIKRKIASVPTVSAVGRYFDTKLSKIGDGPLPPKVGQETTIIIFWNITAAQNTMGGTELKTTLPANVTWKDRVTGGVTYDAGSRTVSLKPGTINAGKAVSATFAVSITPTSKEKNTLMVLTNETILAATDAFTKQPLSQTVPRITTDLSADEGARGKGVVQ